MNEGRIIKIKFQKKKGDEMDRVVERFLLPLFVVMSLLYAVHSFGSEKRMLPIEITKVFHHKTDSSAHIERANISFYFSQEPEVRQMSNGMAAGEKCTQTFFFPHVVFNNAQKDEMIKRVGEHNAFYSVVMKEVIDPVKGIEIIFEYDPRMTSVSYNVFDSIGLQKGVVFHVYNKDLLSQLKKNSNQPVIRTLWHTSRPCIVIDPGHGGIDSGAVGFGGVKEKDLCLAISTTVAQLLEEQGCSVILTRNSDCTVALDERSYCANNSKADLFISIHANHAPNDKAVGVETFCLQPSLFKHGCSTAVDPEESVILEYNYRKSYLSYKLAQSIQRHVCDAVSCYHSMSIDRKVKFSVTQVLLGTQIPSALVEIGFLSNGKELELLQLEWYQKNIARGICDGILAAFSC